ERFMTSLRLAVFGLMGVCLLPATRLAQGLHRIGQRLFGPTAPPSPSQIADHLRGYYAGNHHHGGYGYGGGAGYGYGGGYGKSYRGVFFPRLGKTLRPFFFLFT